MAEQQIVVQRTTTQEVVVCHFAVGPINAERVLFGILKPDTRFPDRAVSARRFRPGPLHLLDANAPARFKQWFEDTHRPEQ